VAFVLDKPRAAMGRFLIENGSNAKAAAALYLFTLSTVSRNIFHFITMTLL
jgi:hypothetical protein